VIDLCDGDVMRLPSVRCVMVDGVSWVTFKPPKGKVFLAILLAVEDKVTNEKAHAEACDVALGKLIPEFQQYLENRKAAVCGVTPRDAHTCDRADASGDVDCDACAGGGS